MSDEKREAKKGLGKGNCLNCDCRIGYCLERVYENARQACIAKGEGWRWGVYE